MLAIDKAGGVIGKRPNLGCRFVLGHHFDKSRALLADVMRWRHLMLKDSTGIRVKITKLDYDADCCIWFGGHLTDGHSFLRTSDHMTGNGGRFAPSRRNFRKVFLFAPPGIRSDPRSPNRFLTAAPRGRRTSRSFSKAIGLISVWANPLETWPTMAVFLDEADPSAFAISEKAMSRHLWPPCPRVGFASIGALNDRRPPVRDRGNRLSRAVSYLLGLFSRKKPMLTFLQLSDIHFRGGDVVDRHGNPLDYDFRERLLTDARAAIAEIGGISGILICGDIANRGIGSEFGQASEWLQNLCAALDVDPWFVWVVPGNHDLDRERIGEAQRALREQLRGCAPDDLDDVFERILADPTDSESLLEPLENYLEFATAFNCAFGSDPFWTERLDLDAEGNLELRGLNSSLLCGKGDHHTDSPMVIGERQATVAVKDRTVHYTLCHHPHTWLRDDDDVDRLFDQHVHVRVTGHLHTRNLRSSPRGIHLEAGAVSPERNAERRFTEPCIPRYELVSLQTVEVGEVLHLDIVVRGRLWDEDVGWKADPGPEGTFARRYRLDRADPGTPIDPVLGTEAVEISRPLLELRYRLARLQPYDRNQCAQRIGAPLDQILRLPAHRRVGEIFAWAEQGDRLADLWDEVMVAAQIPDPPPKPLRS
jgi:hypothetical protein